MPRRVILFASIILVVVVLGSLLWLNQRDHQPAVGASDPETVGPAPNPANPFQGASDNPPGLLRFSNGENTQSAGQSKSPLGSKVTAAPPSQPSLGGPQRQHADSTQPEGAKSTEPKDKDDEPVQLPIAGWVLERRGEPVPSITVTARPRRLAREASAGIGLQTAVTDAGGYFAFKLLAEGEYELRTEATDEFTAAREFARTGTTSTTLIVDAKREKTVTVSGTVTEPQGEPIPTVSVTPINQAQASTRTDASGNYRLNLTVGSRPTSFTFRFGKDGYRDQSLSVPSSALQNTDAFRLDAQLERERTFATVTGLVIDDRSKPIPYTRAVLSSDALKRSYGAIGDGSGKFVFPEVETGDDYSLRVQPQQPYFDPYAEGGLTVGVGGLDLVITLLSNGTGSLEGRMVNLYQLPLPYYTLWLSSSASGGPRNFAVTSDAGGNFSIEKIPAGTVTLASRGNPQFGAGPIAVKSGQTSRADVVVDWGNERLSGLVTDAAGAPVAGAEVKFLWSFPGAGYVNHSRRETITDGNGYFLFSELGPGSHQVVISASGFGAVQLEAAPSPSGNKISVQLQKTGS